MKHETKELIKACREELSIIVNAFSSYGYESTLAFDVWNCYTTNLYHTIAAQEALAAGTIDRKQHKYFVNSYRYIYRRIIKAADMLLENGLNTDQDKLLKLINEADKKCMNVTKRTSKISGFPDYWNNPESTYYNEVRADNNKVASIWGLSVY